MQFSLGILFGIIANLLWGLGFLIPTMLSSFTVIEITLGRCFFYGLISLIIFIVIERQKNYIYKWKIFLTAMLFAFAGNIGYYFFEVYAIKYAGSSITTLIIGILPVSISLYGNWLRREYPFSILFKSIIIIFSGFIVINTLGFSWISNTENITLGEKLLGLISAIIALILWTWYGIYNSIFLKQNPHIHASTWSTLIGIFTLIMSLFMILLVSAITNNTILNINKYLKLEKEIYPVIISSMVLGVLVSWCGNILWNKASTLLSVSLLGQLIVLETIFGLTYIYLYKSQLPNFFEFIGSILIITGVLLAIKNIQYYESKE